MRPSNNMEQLPAPKLNARVTLGKKIQNNADSPYCASNRTVKYSIILQLGHKNKQNRDRDNAQ